MSNTFTHGHALLVGVGADLSNTVDDAQGLAGILRDPERCAYPASQVQTLTGDGAGRGQILAALDKLAQTATTDDTVLVYYSGHGYRVRSTTGEAFYLLPYGYDLQRLYQTAISGAEFTARLRAIPARKLLVLLDCCHAGGVGEAKAPGVTLVKAPLPPEALALLDEGSGRVLVASSKEDELSYAGRPYSAFTLALIEALCGQGVAKQDGTVRVADLALHTREMVPGRTAKRQHPILHFEHADNFAVAYYAGGDDKPKGLPFAVEPEIEPEPGAWRQPAGVTQNVGVVRDNAAVVGSIQGGAGPIHVGGQQHYVDQITAQGPVATHGSAISTGSGVAVVGNRNVVNTGKVGGDFLVNSQKQVSGGSPEDLRALLAELREQLAALQAQGLSADDSADVEAELDQVEELTQRPDPPAKRIVRALENVKDILEAAGVTATAAITALPLVNQAIQLAQTLFAR